jgi:hypothetical protein
LPLSGGHRGIVMRGSIRFVAVAVCAALFTACSTEQTPGNDAPLAFVPADTPYAYANLDPLPSAVTDQWSKRMQEYWPNAFGLYDEMLQKAAAEKTDPLAQRWIKTARVLLDEIKAHDSWDKLRQIGLRPDGHGAFYGVGLVPVLRMELGDAAAFKAEVARIEQLSGEKLPLAKIDAQEYWQLGSDKLAAVIAVEGTHLVVTIVPPNAGDSLKRTLLGLTRPAQNLAATGALQTLAKQYRYSRYGEGYVDFVRLTERLSSAPTGSDAEFAKAVGLPENTTDATCRAEFLGIARKFPRFVMGAEELSATRMRIGAQLEMEPGLAQQFAAAIGPAPGTGAPGEGVVDVSIALPVLKLKDFWIKQADAVGAKPFACSGLTKLNDDFRQSKAKVDVTVPPPFSDALGVRFTLDKFSLDASGKTPDVSGKMVFASNNPLTTLAMAQLAVPGLAQLKLTADGKAVAVPAALVPTTSAPPLFVAMSDKAIGVAGGADERAALETYLRAPSAAEPVFMRMYFSGKFYSMLAQSFDKIEPMLPADQRPRYEQQKKMFAVYEKAVRSGEITFVATPTGIALHETIEQN